MHIVGTCYRFLLSPGSSEWVYKETLINTNNQVWFSSVGILYSTAYINSNFTVRENIFYNNVEKEPFFLDSDENLSKLDMENITIDSNGVTSQILLNIGLKKSGELSYKWVYGTVLDSASSFYKENGVNGIYFEIPVVTFKDLLIEKYDICFELTYFYNNGSSEEDYRRISKTVTYNPVSLSENEKTNSILNSNFNILQNILNNMSEEEKQRALEEAKRHNEAQESRKGILATIKEVVSYINPFSENFFVYKLIELLIEALKNLFIPETDFFTNYFNELKEWFSDRFGFLAYPLELILDILNRILNINFVEPEFSIPDIIEPVTNVKLVSATTYNFNSLLENQTLKNVHDIYFILVDAVIIFALINLAKTKFEEVMTK